MPLEYCEGQEDRQGLLLIVKYVITGIISSVGLSISSVSLTNELQLASQQEKKAAMARLLHGLTQNKSIHRVKFFFLVKFASRFYQRRCKEVSRHLCSIRADRGILVSQQMTQASLWVTLGCCVSSTFASVPGMRRPPMHVEKGRRAKEEQQDQERSGSLAA